MISQRMLLSGIVNVGAGLTLTQAAMRHTLANRPGVEVNDIHSKLNPTFVDDVISVDSITALQTLIKRSKKTKQTVMESNYFAVVPKIMNFSSWPLGAMVYSACLPK